MSKKPWSQAMNELMVKHGFPAIDPKELNWRDQLLEFVKYLDQNVNNKEVNNG